MNVNELIHIISQIALSQDTIKSVYNGDVYTNWNSAEIKYGSLNIGLQNITYNDQLCTYSFIFYYGDRLLQDKKNINSIFTDGVNSIQAVVNLLNQEDMIDIEEQVLYTPFEQQFMDYLAGVYAQIDIIVPSPIGLCSIDNYEYEDEKDLEIKELKQTITSIVEGDSDVTIPYGVETLRDYNFYYSQSTNIELPKTLKHIGVSCFGNSKITNIDLPNSIITIDGAAFVNCTNLRSVVLPSALVEISGNLFFGCSNLENVEIPEGVITINNAAFNSCTRLKTLDIPSTVTTFYPTNALGSVINLKTLIFRGTNPPRTVNSLLSNTPNDLIVYVPDEAINVYRGNIAYNQRTIKGLSELTD